MLGVLAGAQGDGGMTDKLLWTLAEVAEMTGFSVRTLERECAANSIDHVRGPRGRGRFLTREQIAKLIDQLTIPSTTTDALSALRARVARRRARAPA